MTIEYNGNAFEYAERLQARRQQRLSEIYFKAVQKTEAADQEVNRLCQDSMGAFTSAIDGQRQYDRDLVEQFEQNHQIIDDREAQLEDVCQRYQSAIQSFYSQEQSFECQPTAGEDDRARLERLYSEF